MFVSSGRMFNNVRSISRVVKGEELCSFALLLGSGERVPESVSVTVVKNFPSTRQEMHALAMASLSVLSGSFLEGYTCSGQASMLVSLSTSNACNTSL